MTTFKTLTSIGLLLATLSPVLAMDEYQSYERVCSQPQVKQVKNMTLVLYEDCKCDFQVKSDLPGRLVSKEDPEKGEVSIYLTFNDGTRKGEILKNCEFFRHSKGDWECIKRSSERTDAGLKFVESVRKEKDRLIQVTQIIDTRNGIRYVDGLSISPHSPMLYCHKKKSVFDFKMPWK